MTVRIENDNLIVEIHEHGAELQSVRRKDSELEYLWQADPKYWNRHSPVLFPIVGRLKNNQFDYEGHTYYLSQHGFARDLNFIVIEQSATHAVFELRDSPLTKNLYPFSFHFQIRYTLTTNDTVKIEYFVHNPGETPIYFQVGGHPAFNVPLEVNHKFTDYYVNVDPVKEYDRVKLIGPYSDPEHMGTFNPRIPLRLRYDDYKEDAIILSLEKQQTSLILARLDASHGVTMNLKDANYVGIWSPYGKDAPFVCLEPWWGIADTIDADGDITHKFAINKLAGQKDFSANWSLTFF
ncbi:aldose 1-epimerase family protein [Periweissella fabaria]|uniref:Protein LacX, plasmid n=1 Tax=Periweissella fabaria TaxID=546157 RepID=A0ABN8BFK7_9LACO|nr:aldose 1-epimerase family protein [Periweissella fabaria]MCM0596550.1 aldose 1-epimerase family protein [Periweissella fabaria]CAH0415721.1 Protein LacX, plasmid [Periweissella fabaria]